MMHSIREQKYDGIVKMLADALGHLDRAWALYYLDRQGAPTDSHVSVHDHLLVERGHLTAVADRLDDAQIALAWLRGAVEQELSDLGPTAEDPVDSDNG